MALITRLSRLFRADLHAVLDRVEEPEVLLKQAVREMEVDVTQDEQQAKLLSNEQELLSTRLSELEHSLADLDEELDVCFNCENDDLARALIKRKLEAQQLLKVISRKRDSLQSALSELNSRLSENRTKLQAMRQKAELLSENSEPKYSNDNWNVADFTIREEDVEVALLREKQLRSHT